MICPYCGSEEVIHDICVNCFIDDNCTECDGTGISKTVYVCNQCMQIFEFNEVTNED